MTFFEQIKDMRYKIKDARYKFICCLWHLVTLCDTARELARGAGGGVGRGVCATKSVNGG